MFDILLQHNTLVLFGIIFFGIALGSIKIYGLNLGLSGVLSWRWPPATTAWPFPTA